MQQKPLYSNPILKGNLQKLSLGEQVPEMFQEEAMKKGFDINVSAIAPFDPGSIQPLTYEQAVSMGANKMAKSPAMLKAIDEAMKKGPAKLDPQADMPAVLGPELLGAFNPADQYTGGDPLVKGFLGSDFYNQMSTMNVVPYTYQGKEMSGSGSYASDFKKYLESIGKGDLIQFPDQGIMTQEAGLGELKYGSDDSVIPDNNAMIPGPITSTPGADPLQGIGLDGKPIQNGKLGIENLQNTYQNNNNNMSNFKNMEKLLQNIDGGIQSLIDNSSYMQNNNNLSQFPFSNSSSPNFMGGDILKWSSYK